MSDWLIERENPRFLYDLQSTADPGEMPLLRMAAAQDAAGVEQPREMTSLLVADPHCLDLHLSYSSGLEHGPIIRRNGTSSPVMEDPDKSGSYTADPELQRIGSYFIVKPHRSELLRETLLRFCGNYILHGHFRSPDRAKEDARQVLLDSFTTEGRLAPPPRLVRHNLSAQIADLIEDRILSDLIPSLQELFADVPHRDITNEAAEQMGKLYGTSYPDFTQLETHDFKAVVEFNLVKYLRLVVLLSRTKCHEEVAESHELGRIVLMQGCGDLTMNEWNVAFVAWPSHEERGRWALLHPPGEPLNDRKYTCLIKWSCPKEKLAHLSDHLRIVYPYQIATLQFHAPSLDPGQPDRHVLLQGHPIGHLIEFAVCGRRLCRGGRVTKLDNIIHEFSDMRHVFKMVNLNPGESLAEARNKGIEEYETKPRSLFNQSTRNDVWLGEAALIQGDRNLRVAALGHAIQLNLRALGAPREWIDLVLRHEGKKHGTYQYLEPGKDIEAAGQWRWIPEGLDTWLEIFLLRSQYPCSMIGVQAEDEGDGVEQRTVGIVETRRLYFLAHGHRYDNGGSTIRQAASYMRKKGAWDILVFDEGRDVFQLARREEAGKLEPLVPLVERKQLRGVFWATERA